MNKNLIAFGLFASLALATSCSNSQEQEKGETQKEITIEEKRLYKADNSATSLDWNGTYKGTVPCANCEGIEIRLTLNINRTYILVTNYLGRNDALEQENTGSFTWDEAGSIITLGKVPQGPTHYKVGENRIWQLDMSGNMITGDLADHYILTKQ
ncbi:copper resistance protein NlpE [Algoriphagus antarcticus]|uniref:Putative lipoprotein NlpE involved in copper resistance n=1 Tax=Algoriphagus antarcticus TaxID=238540 RepID=A0A3E0E2U5_9BACT|nr:copper resistance protein NlpE [Algoriphagus antarcticus]REG92053.1 putative lipoprotein NlpE involved in copper resistance [Algoriphagus antarcticus]